MKHLYFLIAFITLLGCHVEEIKYDIAIYKNDKIDKDFISKMGNSEKALLSWYLFAYGNECENDKSKAKCQILESLDIKDECSKQHVDFLKKWLDNDPIIAFKLNKCPVLPFKGAIQNDIKSLVMTRHNDTLVMTIEAKGLNNREEKVWEIKQKEMFIIKDNTLNKVL